MKLTKIIFKTVAVFLLVFVIFPVTSFAFSIIDFEAIPTSEFLYRVKVTIDTEPTCTTFDNTVWVSLFDTLNGLQFDSPVFAYPTYETYSPSYVFYVSALSLSGFTTDYITVTCLDQTDFADDYVDFTFETFSPGSGGSFGTTTFVTTPNDDLINFAYTFFIFLGIWALTWIVASSVIKKS